MSPTDRAEDFLALVRRARQGRLKLFLGPAPGVGKTYRMLQEAQQLSATGVDVVIGVIETHGRPETAALIEGLEQVPMRRIEYRGVGLDELDLDGVLARAPEIALIDELAHTNAPGSRNRKRHQDVLDLLEAGIHVFATLNVQHLESLNDLVSRRVGVQVRETVPDVFLRRADQIVNIDLPAEDLLTRLRAGRIYPLERVERALANFFQAGKLESLRELALREVAESIERAQQREREVSGERVGRVALSRLMVGLSSSPNAAALLRRASRLAGRLNAHWFAVHVQTRRDAPDRISATDQRRLFEAQQLAVDLGAEVQELESDDVIAALIDFASAHGVSDIVIGAPPPTHPILAWFTRSVARRMLDHANRFNLHVLATEVSP
ncbi:universal stress protein [Nannocystaceae bacterium ST9]